VRQYVITHLINIDFVKMDYFDLNTCSHFYIGDEFRVKCMRDKYGIL